MRLIYLLHDIKLQRCRVHFQMLWNVCTLNVFEALLRYNYELY